MIETCKPGMVCEKRVCPKCGAAYCYSMQCYNEEVCPSCESKLTISKRLFNFLEAHLTFEDVGDAENGPRIATDYDGPQWAIDAADKANDVYMPEWVNEWEEEA